MRGIRRVGSVRSAAAATTLTAAVALTVAFSASGASGASSRSVARAAASACGTVPTIAPQDPQHVLNTIPASDRAAYNGLTTPVNKTPWASFKGVKKPWKVGLSMGLPLNSAPAINWHAEIVKEFAAAKKKGLVTGSLMQAIAVNPSTYTAADQVAGIEAMIRKGVNAIFVLPLNGDALAPVVTTAGKKGIPMLPFIQTISGSPYRVGYLLAGAGGNQGPAAAAVKQIGGKGNVVIVRGIPGVPYETAAYKSIQQVLSNCPNVKVDGQVLGGWTVPTVKTAMLTFLASHPEKIDAILMDGDYAAGVIQAFQQAGRPIPVIDAATANEGEIAWWNQNPSYCCIFGAAGNSLEYGYSEWKVMERILSGKGLKVSDIVLPNPIITKANYKTYVSKGASLGTVAELGGPDNNPAFSPDSVLNGFFKKPGNT